MALIVAAGHEDPNFYPANPERVLNAFAYYTLQANLLLGVTAALLAIRPQRRSPLFHALRLHSMTGLVVTCLVYHLILAGQFELSPRAQLADIVLHTVTPIMAAIDWLLFRPRGQIGVRIAGWSLVFPLAWLAFTLARGPATGFYPYTFINVDQHGLARVLLNCLLVAALFGSLAFGAAWTDRRRPRGRHAGH
nr:Pr6Pr family membrane protein [Kribbella sandramycini]